MPPTFLAECLSFVSHLSTLPCRFDKYLTALDQLEDQLNLIVWSEMGDSNAVLTLRNTR